MSSIAERIRQNSALCMAGKDLVEEAIINKGGVVPENPESGVPTFANLVDGVNSIPTGSTIITAGSGSSSIEALAQDSISQYDAVKVLVNKNADSTQFIGSTVLPTTAKYNGPTSSGGGPSDKTTSLKYYPEETLGTSIDNKIRYISPSGNFLVMPSTASNTAQQREYGAFPFYKVNGEYVQLTINGIYDTFHVGSFTHWNAWVSDTYKNNSINAICIDETTGIIFAMSNSNYRVFKLDLENMNIIPMHTKDQYFSVSGLSTSNASNPILIGNTLLFEIMDYSGGYRSNVCVAEFDDTTYTIGTAKKIYGGSSQNVHCKMVGYSTKASNTIYVAISSDKDKLVKIQNSTVICETQLPVAISVDNEFNVNGFSLNSSGTKMFILNGTSLHAYIINDNGDNLTFTEITETEFTDTTTDFTNISNAYISRDGMYIMAEKIDTLLETADNVILLEYQFGETGGYKVVSYPLKDFAPVLINYPILNRLLQFNDGQNMIFDIGNNKSMIYKAISSDGKYLMYKSNNLLSSENNLYGFGIAEKNVAIGEIGVASLNVVRTV